MQTTTVTGTDKLKNMMADRWARFEHQQTRKKRAKQTSLSLADTEERQRSREELVDLMRIRLNKVTDWPPSPFSSACLDAKTCPTFHTCPILNGCMCDTLYQGGHPFEGVWDFIPTVFCIATKDRPDRVNVSAAEFHRVGLCKKVVFFRPNRATKEQKQILLKHGFTKPSQWGCWESHRAVAFVARKWLAVPYHLTFEDDVHFNMQATPDQVRLIHSHLKSSFLSSSSSRSLLRLRGNSQEKAETSKNQWAIYFLGHLPMPVVSSPTRLQGLYAVRSGCMHAYIASTQFSDWIIKNPYIVDTSEIGLDSYILFHVKELKAYALHPQIAVQQITVVKSDLVHERYIGSHTGLRLWSNYPAEVDFLSMQLPVLALTAWILYKVKKRHSSPR